MDKLDTISVFFSMQRLAKIIYILANQKFVRIMFVMLGHVWKYHEMALPKLVVAGMRQNKPRIKSGNIGGNFWRISCCYANAGKYLVRVGRKMKTYDWPMGMVRLFPPERIHFNDHRTASVQLNTAFVFFSCDSSILAPFVENETGHAQFHDRRHLLGNRIQKIADIASQHGEKGFWRAQSILFRIVEILRNSVGVEEGIFSVRGTGEKKTESQFVVGILAYLRENLANSITLEDIAHHMHVSPSALSHRFREETSISPIQKFIQMRIDSAKVLLLRGEKLTHIADETGFNSPYHLSRTFKKFTKSTPTMFVKSRRETVD